MHLFFLQVSVQQILDIRRLSIFAKIPGFQIEFVLKPLQYAFLFRLDPQPVKLSVLNAPAHESLRSKILRRRLQLLPR